MNKKYWERFYKKDHIREESKFARFVLENSKGNNLVELGAGNGRDVSFFRRNNIEAIGIDFATESQYVVKENIETFIKKCKSEEEVYTRFFWHAIERKLQLKILKWVKGTLYIEARTVEDEPKNLFKRHRRNLVNVPQLVKDLKKNNFQIIFLKEGSGLAEYKNEDPYVVWIIARKQQY